MAAVKVGEDACSVDFWQIEIWEKDRHVTVFTQIQ